MSDLKFTETHEWVRLEEDGVAVIGITDYAQGELGDVVYVELPEIGKTLNKDDSAATIESVKAASDIKMPITGKIVSINEHLEDEPDLVNKDPLGDGWLFMVGGISDAKELGTLMDKDAYKEII